jgi:hypothetical protein
MNHFHVVSYSTDNRLVGNVVKATEKAAEALAATLRRQSGACRSIGVLSCDNRRHEH